MKYLFFLTLLLCSIIAKGQYVSVAHTFVNSVFEQKFVKLQNNSILGIEPIIKGVAGSNKAKERQSIDVIKYDKDMSVVKKFSIEGNFLIEYENILEFNNKVWVIVMKEPIENKMVGDIVAYEIDTASLQPLSSKTIAEEKNIKFKIRAYASNNSLLQIVTIKSPNNKNLCFYLRNSSDAEFYLSSLNENLDVKTFTKTYLKGFNKTKYFDESYDNIDIDNNGNIYLTYFEKGMGITNENLKLFLFSPDGKQVSKGLVINGFIPSTFKINVGTDNNIYIAGTYSLNSKKTNTVFSGILNRDNFEVSNIKSYEIPISIFQRLDKDRFGSIKEGKTGLDIYEQRCRLLLDDNNNKYLIIQVTSTIGPIDNRHLIFGGTIVVNFLNPDVSYSIIPHYVAANYSQEENNFSFPIFCQQKLLLFYIDNEDNVKQNIDGNTILLNGAKNATLAVAEVFNNAVVNLKIPKIIEREYKKDKFTPDYEKSIRAYINNHCN